MSISSTNSIPTTIATIHNSTNDLHLTSSSLYAQLKLELGDLITTLQEAITDHLDDPTAWEVKGRGLLTEAQGDISQICTIMEQLKQNKDPIVTNPSSDVIFESVYQALTTPVSPSLPSLKDAANESNFDHLAEALAQETQGTKPESIQLNKWFSSLKNLL